MSALIGISIADVTLAATGVPAFTPGTRGQLQTTDGTKEFLYVHAAEAITAEGYLCIADSAWEAEMVDTTSSAPGAGAGKICGAAQAAIADNDWFWIQIYGKGSLRTLASAALGTELTSSATVGAVDDATTSGLEVINGLTLGTATGGSEATNADAYFNYPYVGRTL
tara:strand:+ start:7347 stop:7847 length:501 start_codon:yes stop_codon:yes gene_type:complete